MGVVANLKDSIVGGSGRDDFKACSRMFFDEKVVAFFCDDEKTECTEVLVLVCPNAEVLFATGGQTCGVAGEEIQGGTQMNVIRHQTVPN